MYFIYVIVNIMIFINAYTHSMNNLCISYTYDTTMLYITYVVH